MIRTALDDQTRWRAGDPSSKIRLAVGALINPLRILLTAGQVGDVTAASALIERLRPGHAIADAAYDAGYFRDAIAAAGEEAVIANNPSRAQPIPGARLSIANENLSERCFPRLKNFRCVATRYDKTAGSFLAFVTIAVRAVL